MTASLKPEPPSVAIWTSITERDHIRALTPARPIRPISATARPKRGRDDFSPPLSCRHCDRATPSLCDDKTTATLRQPAEAPLIQRRFLSKPTGPPLTASAIATNRALSPKIL